LPTASSTTLWAARNTNRRTAKAGRARKATVFCSRLKTRKLTRSRVARKVASKAAKLKAVPRAARASKTKEVAEVANADYDCGCLSLSRMSSVKFKCFCFVVCLTL